MYLKSLTLRGFKSFPNRTTLEFGPGVSVIVGPNGSGKSNITDAILWALGEQSPSAVRGQAMQDVIFGGSLGSSPRASAEVELVLDNQRQPTGAQSPSDAAGAGAEGERAALLDLSEIAISRRLDRDGEGEYRLNGARCRLADALEALSDTGLGKDAHSVVSQGRIESIVTSRPRDLRLLLEEAAGLAKYRKRRRQARAKIERTKQNLERALDVEREARGRLRPLERQARAAELHARLQRQILEARRELLVEAHRANVAEQDRTRAAAERARGERQLIEQRLGAVMERREQAEQALSERSERSEGLSRELYAARTAGERMALRSEQLRSQRSALCQRIENAEQEVAELAALPERRRRQAQAAAERIAAIEAQMAESERVRAEQLLEQTAALDRELATARMSLRQAEQSLQAARQVAERARAAAGAERSGLLWRQSWGEVKQLLRSGLQRLLSLHQESERQQALEQLLGEAEGLAQTSIEHALGKVDAAEKVSARAAQELREQESKLASAREELRRLEWALKQKRAESEHGEHAVRSAALQGELAAERRQAEQGERELKRAQERGERLAAQLLAGRELLPEFEQMLAAIAACEAAAGERLSRMQESAERERSQGAELAGKLRECARQEAEVQGLLRAVGDRLTEAEIAAGRCEERAAESSRELSSVLGELAETIAPRRRPSGAERSADAVADGQVAPAERAEAVEASSGQTEVEAGATLAAAVEGARVPKELGVVDAGGEAGARPGDQPETSGAELEDAGAAGEQGERPGPPRAPSAEQLQAELERLLAAAPLSAEEREALQARLQRLERRRQALGPVNPLAEQEYAEAVEHVAELQRQRDDLEAAMRELRGVIREADRRIRETFDETFNAVSGHFAEVIKEVFPGGRGALKLISAEQPEPGDEQEQSEREGADQAGVAAAAESDQAPGSDGAGGAAAAAAESADEEALLGVEIEVAPAGKTTKSLSLLSGGEKSMTALAFLFSLFLARPCPFYVLDEVEAALDDLSLERFLALLRRCAAGAQFIVITHQKRTMEAAEWLYGVSMGADGISKVVSRRLGAPAADQVQLLAGTV